MPAALGSGLETQPRNVADVTPRLTLKSLPAFGKTIPLGCQPPRHSRVSRTPVGLLIEDLHGYRRGVDIRGEPLDERHPYYSIPEHSGLKEGGMLRDMLVRRWIIRGPYRLITQQARASWRYDQEHWIAFIGPSAGNASGATNYLFSLCARCVCEMVSTDRLLALTTSCRTEIT
jgi:hypothetical protein